MRGCGRFGGREIEKVKWVTMNGSTHSPHLEEEEGHMGIILEFLI